jgi:predicted  nucleic acid-binding Zn-ribbon protein
VSLWAVEHPEDHEKLADELERESDRLQERSAELKDEISEVHADWERKRSDEGVPGAAAPSEAEQAEPASDSDDAG